MNDNGRGNSKRQKAQLSFAHILRGAARAGRIDRLLRRAGLTQLVEERLLRSIFHDSSQRFRLTAKGFELDVFGTSVQGYLHERYEPVTLQWMETELTGGERCADVGAHVGLTALVMARAASSTGVVIACEPSPRTFELLGANVARSGLSNIQLVNAACGAAPGTATLAIETQSERNSIIGAADRAESIELVAVETLDRLLPDGVGAFDLVKVDVEGYELPVLRGATQSIDPARTLLVVEWNPAAQEAAGIGALELPTALVRMGYVVEVIDDRRGEVRPLDDVLVDFSRSRFPDDWYVNLACRPSTSKLEDEGGG